jgi:WhiB family transcriptional regulator, redox-sensing transcriptional regulator
MSRTSQGLLRRGPDAGSMDWREHAACRDADPELFFPLGTSDANLLQIDAAKRICQACPVREPCLRWALDSGDSGVWGEARLVSFTEPVATAIANAQNRAALARLAAEQAALRRVATLVARGVPPEEVFAAVTAEAGQLLGAHLAGMGRYESDQSPTRSCSQARPAGRQEDEIGSSTLPGRKRRNWCDEVGGRSE